MCTKWTWRGTHFGNIDIEGAYVVVWRGLQLGPETVGNEQAVDPVNLSYRSNSFFLVQVREERTYCSSYTFLSSGDYKIHIFIFFDRVSRYKFLLITNLTHFFMYLFISNLYMFRASQCSSSGDRIVLIHHLVWLVCVNDCLVCRSWPAYQAVTQTNHTWWCINTIRSPDDEHCDARNM